MQLEEHPTQLVEDELSLDSALFRSCRSYLKTVTLFDHGTATEQATTLLTESQQASELNGTVVCSLPCYRRRA